jgi:hypothetical protein
MKNAPADNLHGEFYILEIDGIPKFEYRVFLQALSAGLQLKHDFPNSSIKIRDADEALKH